MLACARLGASYRVVFGGFSADLLEERLNNMECELLITQDEGWRRRQSGVGAAFVFGEESFAGWVDAVEAATGFHFLEDVVFKTLQRVRVVCDFLRDLSGDDYDSLSVPYDDVARQDENTRAPDRNVGFHRVVDDKGSGCVRLASVCREVEPGEPWTVTKAAVGDQPGDAEAMQPRSHDVAVRRGAGLTSGVDHKDVACAHLFDGIPLNRLVAG